MKQEIDTLRQEISQYRGNGKRCLPSAVWAQAVKLGRRYSVKEVAEGIGVSDKSIYKHMRSKTKVQAAFCEIKPVPTAALEVGEPVSIELRRPDGSELRLRLKSRHREIANLLVGFLR